jgi:hypothetical protein
MASENGSAPNSLGFAMLADEARAMLTRLSRVKPFALHETMVPAAAVSVAAQAAIEEYLAAGRRELRARIHTFLDWLRANAGSRLTLEQAHRRLAFLRLRFNAVLTHFDVFAIVMTQRSEHETGVWLSGLDVVARDALTLPGAPYVLPPVVCYLDRGFGAAIRRARTRLPGGGESPVAIIRVPRERMIGSGIASSLVHEVGHQGAALLDLVNRLRVQLQSAGGSGPAAEAWHLWARWISEIVADFWSVAMLGIGSTLGLMGVLSLPRAFIFRGASDDPHPIPWIRVKLSCAMGDALYPHPQWRQLSEIWSSFYPLRGLNASQRHIIALLERTMPQLIARIADDRPPQLGGRRLIEAMPIAERTPERLRACFEQWRRNPREWRSAAPTLAFAVIGQARADGRVSPEREGQLLAELLAFWALRTTIDTSEACAREPSRWDTRRTLDVFPSALGIA